MTDLSELRSVDLEQEARKVFPNAVARIEDDGEGCKRLAITTRQTTMYYIPSIRMVLRSTDGLVEEMVYAHKKEVAANDPTVKEVLTEINNALTEMQQHADPFQRGYLAEVRLRCLQRRLSDLLESNQGEM